MALENKILFQHFFILLLFLIYSRLIEMERVFPLFFLFQRDHFKHFKQNNIWTRKNARGEYAPIALLLVVFMLPMRALVAIFACKNTNWLNMHARPNKVRVLVGQACKLILKLGAEQWFIYDNAIECLFMIKKNVKEMSVWQLALDHTCLSANKDKSNGCY